jgi:hypothetical protein
VMDWLLTRLKTKTPQENSGGVGFKRIGRF